MCHVAAKFASAAFGIHSAGIVGTLQGSVVFLAAYEACSILQVFAHSRCLLWTVVDSMSRLAAIETNHRVFKNSDEYFKIDKFVLTTLKIRA